MFNSALASHAVLGRLHSRTVVLIPVFVGLFVFLSYLARNLIWHAGFEVGDAAANSLLVEDAKHFALTTGNYSRVGFYHPGPAILYVLAFGDWLLHDLTGIVSSHAGAQIATVCAYSAFFLTASAYLLFVSTRSAPLTAITILVFMACISLVEEHAFNNLWFPRLYIAPFLLFVVASASLVYSPKRGYVLWSIALGFLVNGHASFLSTAPVMIVAVGLAKVALRGMRLWPAPLWALVDLNRRGVLYAFGILALFMLPLAVETYRSWPGPLFDYVRYGSQNAPHRWLEAFRFVAWYWTGMPLAEALAGAAIVARVAIRRPRLDVSLLMVLFGATVAAVFYAKVGIDDLHQRYVGLFYYVVPAMFVAWGAAAAVSLLGRTAPFFAAPVVAALCVVSMADRLSHDNPQREEYDVPAVGDYAAKLLAAAPAPFVVEMDTKEDGGHVSNMTVASLLFARRQGLPSFCVESGQGGLSFSRSALCSPGEVASEPHVLVSASKDVPEGARLASESDGVRLYTFGAGPRAVR